MYPIYLSYDRGLKLIPRIQLYECIQLRFHYSFYVFYFKKNETLWKFWIFVEVLGPNPKNLWTKFTACLGRKSSRLMAGQNVEYL